MAENATAPVLTMFPERVKSPPMLTSPVLDTVPPEIAPDAVTDVAEANTPPLIVAVPSVREPPVIAPGAVTLTPETAPDAVTLAPEIAPAAVKLPLTSSGEVICSLFPSKWIDALPPAESCPVRRRALFESRLSWEMVASVGSAIVVGSIARRRVESAAFSIFTASSSSLIESSSNFIDRIAARISISSCSVPAALVVVTSSSSRHPSHRFMMSRVLGKTWQRDGNQGKTDPPFFE